MKPPERSPMRLLGSAYANPPRGRTVRSNAGQGDPGFGIAQPHQFAGHRWETVEFQRQLGADVLVGQRRADLHSAGGDVQNLGRFAFHNQLRALRNGVAIAALGAVFGLARHAAVDPGEQAKSGGLFLALQRRQIATRDPGKDLFAARQQRIITIELALDRGGSVTAGGGQKPCCHCRVQLRFELQPQLHALHPDDPGWLAFQPRQLDEDLRIARNHRDAVHLAAQRGEIDHLHFDRAAAAFAHRDGDAQRRPAIAAALDKARLAFKGNGHVTLLQNCKQSGTRPMD